MLTFNHDIHACLTSFRQTAGAFTQRLRVTLILQPSAKISLFIKDCSPKMPLRNSGGMSRPLGLSLQKFVTGGVSFVRLNFQFLRSMK
jgi:hypothetical protein